MADRMTQTQVVRHLAERTGTTNKTSKEFLTALTELLVQQTKKAGVFVVPGLGRAKKIQRKARMGRNPMTGAEIKIPAKTAVKFTMAKAVKDAIAPPKAKK